MKVIIQLKSGEIVDRFASDGRDKVKLQEELQCFRNDFKNATVIYPGKILPSLTEGQRALDELTRQFNDFDELIDELGKTGGG